VELLARRGDDWLYDMTAIEIGDFVCTPYGYGRAVIKNGNAQVEFCDGSGCSIHEIYPINAHVWKCISPGEYDSTYECQKCGAKHIESIDNLDSKLPDSGCV
jgi:hypothetical protein